MYALRVGGKGRIVLPAALRAEVHVEEGSELIAYVEDARIMLETREDVRRRLRAQAAAAGGKGDAVEGLLADRRADLAMEEERLGPRPDVG